MEHQHHGEHQPQPQRDSSQAHYDMNPSMGHAGLGHQAMMFDDFKKRFYTALVLMSLSNVIVAINASLLKVR